MKPYSKTTENLYTLMFLCIAFALIFAYAGTVNTIKGEAYSQGWLDGAEHMSKTYGTVGVGYGYGYDYPFH